MNERAGPWQRPARARLGTSGILLFLGLLPSEATASAPAAPAESVVVSAPQCKAAPFSLPSFVDSLRVELSESGLRCCILAGPDDGTSAAGSLVVDVALVPCAPDAEGVHVSVRDPAHARAVERELSWADVADSARPRAIALAVAELIRSLQTPPRDMPAETVHTVAPPLPPSPVPERRAGPSALSLHLAAEARVFPTLDTLAWGGRLRCSDHWRWLHLDLDVGALYARSHDDLGEVSVRAGSAGVGVGPRLVVFGVIVDLGVRAELGWAWLRGDPARNNVHSDRGSALTSSVGARLSLEVPASLKLRPGLAFEGGAILRGIEGDVSQRSFMGLTGSYAMLSLGVGVSL